MMQQWSILEDIGEKENKKIQKYIKINESINKKYIIKLTNQKRRKVHKKLTNQ